MSVRDIVSRLTLEEKAAQLRHEAPAVERVGLPAHDYWSECVHGVARAGIATVFPQAINLAATWDVDLVHRVACAISDEARAKHHEAVRAGAPLRYRGLTYFSPNINLLRDPRWGRGQETYGEDPFLTGRMAVAFIRGLQGEDPYHLKIAATPKHFAAHSGPEVGRHGFDARVSEHDLRDSYLPAFEAAIREGGAASIMTAYNRLNGEPCSSNARLLDDTLRGEWGFEGFVVSDSVAINGIFGAHGVEKSAPAAVARALRAGLDLECGRVFACLPEAVERGLVSEADVDRALTRVLRVRARLGGIDGPSPYAGIPMSVVDCEAHRDLALEAARKSIVLLENDGILPLQPGADVAVIGPNADSLDVLLGNYHGTPSRHTTILQGLQSRAKTRYAPGCDLVDGTPLALQQAVDAATRADLAVLVLGLSPRIEGEEVDAGRGDRDDLRLPAAQSRLLRAVAATGRPIVLVLTGGGPVVAEIRTAAALWVGYPGEEGGTAVAGILFGRCNPYGRLPFTWYEEVSDLPPFDDYSMSGRTWRYFRGRARYPFGHGLQYGPLRRDGPRLENVGARTVSLVAARRVDGALCGFERVELQPGEKGIFLPEMDTGARGEIST